jgi:acetyl esterase/lipase
MPAISPLVDPELVAGLEALPFRDFSAGTLSAVRAVLAEGGQLQREQTAADGVRLTEKAVPRGGDGGAVRVLCYQPERPPAQMPVLLHIHGGGLVSGTPEVGYAAAIRAVQIYQCTVISVDYRLAPEAPYPAAIDDCYTVLAWLYAQADALGIDRNRIIVGGESAGGGLAAALCIMARDRGAIPIAHQMLTYPMLDDRTCVRETIAQTGQYVWTRASNRFGWQSYLGRAPGDAGIPVHAAPGRCENMKGLPPAFIAVGALDLFLEEDVRYAMRLIAAGVGVTLEIYPGAYHAFTMFTETKAAKKFQNDWSYAFARAIAPAKAQP